MESGIENEVQQARNMGGVSTTESKALRAWPIVAHVGLYQSFGAYLNSYEFVVEHLFAGITQHNQPVDVVAPPLLFLMRHAMELGYKFTLWELHEMNGEPYDAKAYGNHKLRELHAALRAQHAKAITKYELPDNEVSNFDEYCQKTEAGMKQFEALDGTSFNFRYPIDKTGMPNFSRDQTVDLRAVKQSFDDAMILLRHTADVLGEYVDIHRWMEADMRSNWY